MSSSGKSARLSPATRSPTSTATSAPSSRARSPTSAATNGLPPGTLDLKFNGSAGQSFGAFLVPGMRLILNGEANDYVGKGMSGGEIIIRPRAAEKYVWSENAIIGNTCLYGATGGTLFAAGRAGERFAVRNSGATAVVEGVGDHGCEYMTNGTVVVLGPVGKNFGAGMSGGLAFVHDESNVLADRINPQMISIERLNNEEEVSSLKRLVAVHAKLTGSPHAQALIDRWETEISRFWKVVPHTLAPDAPKQVYAFDATKMPIAV